MAPVLQDRLPSTPWTDPALSRLPGVQPLGNAPWLIVDEAFAGQMALRDAMIGTLQHDIYRCLREAEDAASECLELALTDCADRSGYDVSARKVRRPDGVTVTIDHKRPLLTLGRIIQEDVCLLLKHGDEHILAGAILCFPASWTLAEKIGRPLIRVHKPVAAYIGDMARRVQRLFDGLKVGRPLWRANALIYKTPDLFSPRREVDGDRDIGGDGRYLRSERQVLMRLPRTDAIAFTIHTYVVPLERLDAKQRETLLQNIRPE